MQCTAPKLFNGTWCPCGKCRACRDAKAREWSLRMGHELEQWAKAVFITLTYEDENLPIDGSISKDEIQRFLKRLRKEVAPRRIKYYACGEY